MSHQLGYLLILLGLFFPEAWAQAQVTTAVSSYVSLVTLSWCRLSEMFQLTQIRIFTFRSLPETALSSRL